MKVYKFPRTDDNIYFDVLDNKLSVCIIPNENFPTYYAALGVRYGSLDLEFIPKGEKEFIKTPAGIAHFLEHKKFELDADTDANDFFSKHGASANASTSFKQTKYYIWGGTNFKENLNHLLNYVFTPYFTDESVNKEIDIINEEIKMYDDEPGWILDQTVKQMLFYNHPMKEKLAGTYESISNVTAKELIDCYNTFYVPNNMFLIASGNISLEDVLEVIENNELLKKQKPSKIIRKEYEEKDSVKEEYKELKLNICIPKVKYCFKMNLDKFRMKDQFKLELYLNMLESIVFGSASEFAELVKKENVVEGFYVEHYTCGKHLILEFNAESDKSDIFKEMVDNCLYNLHITEEELKRMKRVWIASEIKITDKSDMLANSLLDDFIEYENLCNERINIIDDLNIEELTDIVNDLYFENNSFLLANPKDSSNNEK